MDNGNRFLRLAVGSAAAQGKIRDIDFVCAENGADLPDDAGHIAVAQVNQVAFERSLDVNAIDVEQAWRPFMKHGALPPGALRCWCVKATRARCPRLPWNSSACALHE